jgi:uncharacterized membrane protein YtjA (UPF0391 family)
MLRLLASFFLVIALIWAVVGVGGITTAPWEGGKVLFVVFLGLAGLAFLGHQYRTRSPWDD